MLFFVFWQNIYGAVAFFCSLHFVQGAKITILQSSSTWEEDAKQYESRSSFISKDTIFISTSVLETEIRENILPTDSMPGIQATQTHFSHIPHSTLPHDILTSSSENILLQSLPENHNDLYTLSSETLSFEKSSVLSENTLPSKFYEEYITPTPPLVIEEKPVLFTERISLNSSLMSSSNLKASPLITETTTYNHFHTPLMSLFVAPTSVLNIPHETFHPKFAFNSLFPQLLTNSPFDNESAKPEFSAVPTEQEHKKLLMLVLRAEDCSKFSKSDFEKMLSKLMVKFGFGNVVPEVSNAKCYSHLNINVTVGGSTPTLRFLPNIDKKNNFTVDVLNRTFRIVKLEKVDLKFEKSKSSNSSSSVIAAVARHESVAYIAVGVSFGLVLVICISVCCIKCCCLRKPQKRFNAPKGTHVRLRPEDYTLTPIPRPTSLYVDYYRGSVTADIYSTTSAGSIASTTPTVEQGVVQPFDTSIVPLEDSSALHLDSSRDPSVDSVPVHSDLKTFNISSISGKTLRIAATDSKEQLNPKQHSRKVETKNSGVANPTFQRY
ncbi:hypothetical protein X975_09023, partial [Stegodyphus mimosarum]